MDSAKTLQLVMVDDAVAASAEKLRAVLSSRLRDVLPPGTQVSIASLPPPEGGWTLPLLRYAHANAALHAEKLALLPAAPCCVMVDAPLKFPFLEALRKRAREALGEMEIIELPPLPEGGAPLDDDTLAALQRIVKCLRLPPAAAVEKVDDAETQAKAPSDEEEEGDGPAAPLPPLEVSLLAEMAGFPLRDIYGKLSEHLPPALPPPAPLTEAATVAHSSIQAIVRHAGQSADADRKVLRRFAAVCLLLLADKNRPDSEQYLHEAAALIGKEDAEFAPLGVFSAVLAAQRRARQAPEEAHRALAALLPSPESSADWRRNTLLHAAFMRVWLDLLPACGLQSAQQECMERYYALLQKLGKDEIEALGAASFVKIRRLREKMRDLF